jgi:hypothetical protein
MQCVVRCNRICVGECWAVLEMLQAASLHNCTSFIDRRYRFAQPKKMQCDPYDRANHVLADASGRMPFCRLLPA